MDRPSKSVKLGFYLNESDAGALKRLGEDQGVQSMSNLVTSIVKEFLVHAGDSTVDLTLSETDLKHLVDFQKRKGLESVAHAAAFAIQEYLKVENSAGKAMESSETGRSGNQGTPSSKLNFERESSLHRRRYGDYQSYSEHQYSKLSKLDLNAYDSRYRAVLGKRLEETGVRKGASVLCLAARIGTECKAFRDVGCFAVGIDLNPGLENRYVTYGDFHNLQFADQSVDYVFTNSLDHVFELDKVISEIVRVLKPQGRFIAEICGGSLDAHGREPGDYESFWWDRIDNLVEKLGEHGLLVESRRTFTFPWGGDHVVFNRSG